MEDNSGREVNLGAKLTSILNGHTQRALFQVLLLNEETAVLTVTVTYSSDVIVILGAYF